MQAIRHQWVRTRTVYKAAAAPGADEMRVCQVSQAGGHANELCRQVCTQAACLEVYGLLALDEANEVAGDDATLHAQAAGRKYIMPFSMR